MPHTNKTSQESNPSGTRHRTALQPDIRGPTSSLLAPTSPTSTLKIQQRSTGPTTQRAVLIREVVATTTTNQYSIVLVVMIPGSSREQLVSGNVLAGSDLRECAYLKEYRGQRRTAASAEASRMQGLLLMVGKVCKTKRHHGELRERINRPRRVLSRQKSKKSQPGRRSGL
jgi:hypothetical protein